MDKVLTIYMEGSQDLICESVVLIPGIAIDEPGYIKFFTIKDSANAKHEYHAMAQMAYFQYQDDELEMIEVDVPLRVKTAIEEISLESGMVLARLPDGEFKVMVHGMQNKKKLLEAGYRYCTRWVRLDI